MNALRNLTDERTALWFNSAALARTNKFALGFGSCTLDARSFVTLKLKLFHTSFRFHIYNVYPLCVTITAVLSFY